MSSIDKKGTGKHSGSPNANILPYSDFSNITNNDYVFIDNTKVFNGSPTIKITASNFTSNSYKGGTSVNLKNYLTPGQIYTASVGVYIPTENNIDVGYEWRIYQQYNNSSSTDGTGFAASLSSIPKDTGVRYSKVYTIRDDMTNAYFNMNIVKNGTYGIAEPKIEAGNVLTSYVPDINNKAYTGDINGFIEYNDIARIQKNNYIEANSFIEI